MAKKWNVYFFKTETEPSKEMKMAFELMVKQQYKPEWINFNQLKKKALLELEIIIMETFSGTAFEYLQGKKARIMGPYTINYCNESVCPKPKSNLPMRLNPIYSQCMRGLFVTSSNMNISTKKALENKITMMSGVFQDDLYKNTAFLVTDSVLTEKSLYARKNKIPILSTAWVDNCWNKYQLNYQQANDEQIISKYSLPLLFNLNFSISGLNSIETNKIKELIETNGGKYHSNLPLKFPVSNMIFLLNNTNDCKYEYANKKNFLCLQAKWIYDSVKAGYLLPFEQYNIKLLEKENLTNKSKTNVPLISVSAVPVQKNLTPIENEMLSDDETIIYDLSENNSEEIDFDSNLIEISKKPLIMFEGFNLAELNELFEKTEKIPQISIKDKLGNGTHLILKNPIGTEKVLSAIAAGSWILKQDFIFDSLKMNKLVSENKFQWGWEFVDKLETINSVSEKLMVSGLRWKCYLDKNEKKLFEGIRFLFITTDSLMMNCCKSILSSGGAKLYFIDDLKTKQNSLLPIIDYALIDNKLENKPNVQMELISSCIEYFQSKNTLISYQNVLQFILDGPSHNVSAINSLKDKFSINLKNITNSLFNIYGKNL